MNIHTSVTKGPATRVGAVLLAAGAASRLGGRPKALLELDGTPLVVRQLLALAGAGIQEVAVVVGHHAAAVEAAISGHRVKVVRNPSPDEGQPSSVRLGLQALAADVDGILVALVDQPLVDARDILALVDAYACRGDRSMVVPRVRAADGSMAPGNPVIFDPSIRAQWQRGEVATSGRHWREKNPDRVSWFDTENQHYRIDIDTPEDLQRFEAATGHRLVRPAAPAGGGG